MPIVSQDFSPIPLNGQRRLEELCRFEIVDTLPE